MIQNFNNSNTVSTIEDLFNIYNDSDDLIFIIDNSLKIIYLNLAAAKPTDKSIDELTGCHLNTILMDKADRIIEKGILSLRKGDPIPEIEITINNQPHIMTINQFSEQTGLSDQYIIFIKTVVPDINQMLLMFYSVYFHSG